MKAEAPRPTRERFARPAGANPSQLGCLPIDLPDDTVVNRLTSTGTFWLDKVNYMVSGRYACHQVLVVTADDKITVTDTQGEILIEHSRPAPGVKYVGNGPPPGLTAKNSPPSPMSRDTKRHRCPETPSVTDVLMQNCH